MNPRHTRESDLAPTPLDDDVRAAVERAYRPEDRQRVLDALLCARRPSRPLILILAEGDPERVDVLVECDRDDWRSVLDSFYGWYDRAGGLAELVRRCRDLGLPVPHPWCLDLPEQIEADVRQFVGRWFVRLPEQMLDDVQLQGDLGLTSRPAGPEFIRSFAEKFHVDVTAFRTDDHFHARDWDGLGPELLRIVFRRTKRPLVPITVRDLITAAKTKRLDLRRAPG